MSVKPIVGPDGKTTIPSEVIESMQRNKIGLKGESSQVSESCYFVNDGSCAKLYYSDAVRMCLVLCSQLFIQRNVAGHTHVVPFTGKPL